LIFQTVDPEQGWDGYIKGNRANADIYLYSYAIEYDDENGLGKQVNGGTVNLIR
jgi:hypothetical protein